MKSKQPSLLTIPQFAEIMNLKQSKVRNMIFKGELKMTKIGRLVRIPYSEVNRITSGGAPSQRPVKKTKSKDQEKTNSEDVLELLVLQLSDFGDRLRDIDKRLSENNL